ncbi:hypothetical protein [Methanosarcina sp. DH1]|nr:hypothetical protein [Methanosarcina sp. DH1]
MAEEICRKTRAAAKSNLENLEFMQNRKLKKPDINKRKKLESKAEQK